MNVGVKIEEMQYKTMEQLQKDEGTFGNGVFERWKQYENNRRLSFAKVMKERRRLKE